MTLRKRFHSNGFPISGQGTPFDPFRITGTKSTLEITFVGPSGVSYENTSYSYPGVSHPLLLAKKTDVNPVYFSILYPRKPDFPRPEITQLNSKDGIACKLKWQDREDYLVYNKTSSSIRVSHFASDARITMTMEMVGKIIGYIVGEGTNVSHNGKTLISGENSVNAVYSDKVLKIVGNVVGGKFYGPGVTKVLVNDMSCGLSKKGDYIVVGSKP